MFATTFTQFEFGYELSVDSSRGQLTSDWLSKKGCRYLSYQNDGSITFFVTHAPTEIIQGLSHKNYPSNDNSLLAANADLLRQAMQENDWLVISALTETWSEEFKKAVWMLLTKDERKEIRFLSLKHSEMADFKERLYDIDSAVVKKMVVLLKEVGLIKKDFKVSNKTTDDFVEQIMSNFQENEKFVRASLELACACVDSEKQ